MSRHRAQISDAHLSAFRFAFVSQRVLIVSNRMAPILSTQIYSKNRHLPQVANTLGESFSCFRSSHTRGVKSCERAGEKPNYRRNVKAPGSNLGRTPFGVLFCICVSTWDCLKSYQRGNESSYEKQEPPDSASSDENSGTPMSGHYSLRHENDRRAWRILRNIVKDQKLTGIITCL